jgi:hypothetical protein
MTPTLEIGLAIFMVAVSVALIVWFSRYMLAASGKRLIANAHACWRGPRSCQAR